MRTDKWSRVAMAGIPWLIILGMIFTAYLPIFRGTKYLLPVKPRDPRDFFRGNYVDLAYEFSNIPRGDIALGIDAKKVYMFGDRLYLDFEKADGVLKPIGLYDTAEAAKNIRLKVQPRFTINESSTSFDIVAGIESFFAPKKEAEDWEKALRDGKVFAEVAIDSGGNARITALKVQRK